MTNSVENTPGQPRVLHSPPETAHEKCAGESKVHYQPDDASHSQPVDKPNYNDPIPGIALARLFYKGQDSSNGEARITQGIDKVQNTPEPLLAAYLRFQYELLSAPDFLSQGPG